MPKQSKQPRTSREVLRLARRTGGTVVHGGRHDKVYGPRPGHVAVPRHGGDLPTGTLHAIMKGLRAIGLFLLVLAIPICLTVWLVAGLSGM